MSEDAPVRAVESSDPAIVYLDHGASSWPKPPVVVDAVIEALTQVGGNPGRGGHRLALEATRRIFAVRQTCATLLGVPDSKNLIFTSGCTAACNMMLKGVLKPGDRVVVGSMEHNAVARPLEVLQAAGVEVVRVQGDSAGVIDPDAVEAAVRARPTRAVICQHASNVSGTIQPIAQIADVAHEAGALMLVDGAQAGGHLDLDLAALGADAYAVSGHKGMLGPQGVGLLYIEPELEVEEICQGGTGSHSESTQMPTERPDRYEAGTPNTPGILGIGAAAAFLAEEGRSQRQREATLIRELHEGILALGTLHRSRSAAGRRAGAGSERHPAWHDPGAPRDTARPRVRNRLQSGTALRAVGARDAWLPGHGRMSIRNRLRQHRTARRDASGSFGGAGGMSAREYRPFVVFGFRTTHEALAAEVALRDAGIEVVPIPTPPVLGELCGIALRVRPEHADAALAALEQGAIVPDARGEIEDI